MVILWLWGSSPERGFLHPPGPLPGSGSASAASRSTTSIRLWKEAIFCFRVEATKGLPRTIWESRQEEQIHVLSDTTPHITFLKCRPVHPSQTPATHSSRAELHLTHAKRLASLFKRKQNQTAPASLTHSTTTWQTARRVEKGAEDPQELLPAFLQHVLRCSSRSDFCAAAAKWLELLPL